MRIKKMKIKPTVMQKKKNKMQVVVIPKEDQYGDGLVKMHVEVIRKVTMRKNKDITVKKNLLKNSRPILDMLSDACNISYSNNKSYTKAELVEKLKTCIQLSTANLSVADNTEAKSNLRMLMIPEKNQTEDTFDINVMYWDNEDQVIKKTIRDLHRNMSKNPKYMLTDIGQHFKLPASLKKNELADELNKRITFE